MATINGTSGADEIHGTSGPDDMYGFEGDDIIAGGTGRDTLQGGPGRDLLAGGDSGSIYDGGPGVNGLELDRSYLGWPPIKANPTPIAFTFSPGVSGTLQDGTSYSNFDYLSLFTGAGNDDVGFKFDEPKTPVFLWLNFFLQNSWNAGDGTDTATVDLSGSTVSYTMPPPFLINGIEQAVKIQVTSPRADLLTFQSVENYHLIGGSADDNFTTRRGTDILTGGGGNDTLDGGEGLDIARYSGGHNDYQIDQLSGTSFKVTDLRAGSPDGTDTLSNIERLQWADGTTVLLNSPPEVITQTVVAAPGQILSMASLFSASDVDGNAITRYQLWDDTRDAQRPSGYFVINGVAQAAKTAIDVTPAQLGQVSFVVGTIGDSLQIRASDGSRWSAGDSDRWSSVSVIVNNRPFVSTGTKVAGPNQSLSLSGLVAVSDADGDSVVKYQLWDATRDPNAGHFVVDGVAQAAGGLVEITAAQVAQTSFVTGLVGDSLQIRAFDGASWSADDDAAWSPFTIQINRPPVVATSNQNLGAGQSRSLSSLFTVSDPENNSITRYQLWDGTSSASSGHFTVNGATQAANSLIEITAAQLNQTSFVTGTVNDTLQVRAFDGTSWSAGDNATWSPFLIGPAVNRAPTLSSASISRRPGQTLTLSSLLTVNDLDGDTIQKYQLWDSNRDPNSGHFVVNGVSQPGATLIEITAAQLAQTSFVTGGTGDALQVRVFDGKDWSAADNAAWASINVAITNSAPVVTTADVPTGVGQSLTLSSLFTVNDGDGDTITRYQLWDSSRDPSSGHFVVNGVAQAAGTLIDITAAQLSQTTFLTGSVADTLQIRASDGFAWSAADNATWAPFQAGPPGNRAPTVSSASFSFRPGESQALSSLLTVNDLDGDTIQKYQLWDSTRDPSSGHFVVNGVDKPAATLIEISAADLAQTGFVTGGAGDTLQVRVFDGQAWSAADNATWASIGIAITNDAPVMDVTDLYASNGQLLFLSSMFNVYDGDGDAMTRYQLWDSSRDPNSGHFSVNGVAQSAGTLIDVSAAQLSQTVFLVGSVGDTLQIRAFDGFAWSAADNEPWAPFHINIV